MRPPGPARQTAHKEENLMSKFRTALILTLCLALALSPVAPALAADDSPVSFDGGGTVPLPWNANHPLISTNISVLSQVGNENALVAWQWQVAHPGQEDWTDLGQLFSDTVGEGLQAATTVGRPDVDVSDPANDGMQYRVRVRYYPDGDHQENYTDYFSPVSTLRITYPTINEGDFFTCTADSRSQIGGSLFTVDRSVSCPAPGTYDTYFEQSWDGGQTWYKRDGTDYAEVLTVDNVGRFPQGVSLSCDVPVFYPDMDGLMMRLAVVYTPPIGEAQGPFHSPPLTLKLQTSTGDDTAGQGMLATPTGAQSLVQADGNMGESGTDPDHTYTLRLAAGQAVWLSLLPRTTGPHALSRPTLAVLDSQGAVLASGLNAMGSLYFTAPAEGVYTLRLGGSGTDRAYRLQVERPDALDRLIPHDIELRDCGTQGISLEYIAGSEQPLTYEGLDSRYQGKPAYVYQMTLPAGAFIMTGGVQSSWRVVLLDSQGWEAPNMRAQEAGVYRLVLMALDPTAADITDLRFAVNPSSLSAPLPPLLTEAAPVTLTAHNREGGSDLRLRAPQPGFARVTVDLPQDSGVYDARLVYSNFSYLAPIGTEWTIHPDDTSTMVFTLLVPQAGDIPLALNGTRIQEGSPWRVSLELLPAGARLVEGPSSVLAGSPATFTVAPTSASIYERPWGFRSAGVQTPTLAWRPVSWSCGGQSGPVAEDGSLTVPALAAGSYPLSIVSDLFYLEGDVWRPVRQWPILQGASNAPLTPSSVTTQLLTLDVTAPAPTGGPTVAPTVTPTLAPTAAPSAMPTAAPSAAPSARTGDAFPWGLLALGILAAAALAAATVLLWRRRKA